MRLENTIDIGPNAAIPSEIGQLSCRSLHATVMAYRRQLETIGWIDRTANTGSTQRIHLQSLGIRIRFNPHRSGHGTTILVNDKTACIRPNVAVGFDDASHRKHIALH